MTEVDRSCLAHRGAEHVLRKQDQRDTVFIDAVSQETAKIAPSYLPGTPRGCACRTVACMSGHA